MRALVLLAAVVLAAGCSLGGGDNGAPIEAGELAGLVLQPNDVPRAFVRFDEGPQSTEEQRSGGSGWKARYQRPGTPETDGPIVVASLIDRFESEGEARDGLDERRADLVSGELDWKAVAAPDLGDEAFALSVEQGSGASRVVFFVVAWRDANVAASVEANGFAGKVDLTDAVELARRQAQRIERARS
jgi:hypothetical protein